jgi:antirestriction protein ArdC
VFWGRKIIEELEQGTTPWVKPWQGGDVGMPYNATSQRRYSGVNVLLLWDAEYLGSWLAILKADKKATSRTASKATEAAQYLEAAGGVAVEGDVEEAA